MPLEAFAFAPGEEPPAGAEIRLARVRVLDRDGEELEVAACNLVAGGGDDRRHNVIGADGSDPFSGTTRAVVSGSDSLHVSIT